MKTKHQKNKDKEHLAKLNKEYRKEFFANLQQVCNAYAGYDLYSKFPEHILDRFYKYRFRQFKVVGTNLSEREIGQLTADITHHMSEYFDLPNGGRISCSMQLVEGFTLSYLANFMNDWDFPAASEAKKVLEPWADTELLAPFILKVNQVFFSITMFDSSIDKGCITGKMEQELTNSKDSMRKVFRLSKYLPVREQFLVEGNSRPAFRVGWVTQTQEMKWAEVKPSQVGMKNNDDTPMPVFIQSHALMRLEERIGLPSGAMHLFVMQSFLDLRYHHDDHGRLMVDYAWGNQKLGYLVCSIEQRKVLIHTFLFITNSGTPEGKKLTKLTGLQKVDIMYLAIDKLSTLLQYNIKSNEKVMKIFIKAGCGHLIDVEDTKHFLMQPSKLISTESIARYLVKR